MLADRYRHGAAGALDLVGQLGAGRRGAEHQDAAAVELIRVAVIDRADPGDTRRRRFVKRRNAGDVAGAAGQHDRAAAPLAAIGGDHISATVALHRGDVGMGLHRRRNGARITVDEFDGLGHRAVAVGIVALIAVAGQPALPVGRQQAQRIPALGTPCMGDLTALQHDMIDGALRQAPAHRQAGLAAADDNGCGGTNRTRSRRQPRQVN